MRLAIPLACSLGKPFLNSRLPLVLVFWHNECVLPRHLQIAVTSDFGSLDAGADLLPPGSVGAVP